MFRCPITNRVSSPGEKPVKVVVETRQRVYYDTPDGKMPREGEKGEEIGFGTEVVKELSVSQRGAEILKKGNVSDDDA